MGIPAVLGAFLLAIWATPALALSSTLQARDIEDLARIFHGSKPAPNLLCTLKIREVREERRFSTGTKWVEMIEVTYLNNRDYARRETKAYFPVGSKLVRREVVSEFSGLVEEIVLEAGDRLGHTLTFQHDGRGQIVWMMMHNELMVNPCQLR